MIKSRWQWSAFVGACCLSSNLIAMSLLIGIAGGSGSGKAVLAKHVAELFPDEVVIVNQNRYYKDLRNLPESQRDKVNFDHPSALDFALLAQHIKALSEGNTIECPEYDFSTHMRRKTTTTMVAKPIILVEGMLVLAVPEIRNQLQLSIFVESDDDIRLLRRIERDMQERKRSLEMVQQQYLLTVRPMHMQFVEPSRRFADFTVRQSGDNQQVINLISLKIQEFLKQTRLIN